MQFCIYEDNLSRNLLPLTALRPVFDLRCGASSLLEKIERVLPARARIAALCRPGLADLVREEFHHLSVNEPAEDDTWFINGRIIADDALKALLRPPKGLSGRVFRCGGVTAAAFAPASG